MVVLARRRQRCLAGNGSAEAARRARREGDRARPGAPRTNPASQPVKIREAKKTIRPSVPFPVCFPFFIMVSLNTTAACPRKPGPPHPRQPPSRRETGAEAGRWTRTTSQPTARSSRRVKVRSATCWRLKGPVSGRRAPRPRRDDERRAATATACGMRPTRVSVGRQHGFNEVKYLARRRTMSGDRAHYQVGSFYPACACPRVRVRTSTCCACPDRRGFQVTAPRCGLPPPRAVAARGISCTLRAARALPCT